MGTFIVIILLLGIAVFFGFSLVAYLQGYEEVAFLCMVCMFIFCIFSLFPVTKTEKNPITDVQIVFNQNGAIVAYEGKNYTFTDYALVESIRNNKVKFFKVTKYNVYGMVDSQTVQTEMN